MNSLSSQCFSDLILINIEINDEKEFEIKNIVNEKKIDYDSHKKLQYKIK